MRTKFLISVATLLLLVSSVCADFRALCVGINCYNCKDEPYVCPFNRDAEAFHHLFRKQHHHSKILYGHHATYRHVCRSVVKLQKSSKDGDITFILFSTHGGTENGDFVICLADEELLTGKELLELILPIKGAVILVLDTCHAGAFFKHKTPDNVIVFAASKENQSARWINLSKIKKKEACGYISRPIFNAFSGKSDLNNNKHLEVFEIVVEIVITEIPEPPEDWWTGEVEKQELIYRVPPKLMKKTIH